jgi:hypothetical protein
MRPFWTYMPTVMICVNEAISSKAIGMEGNASEVDAYDIADHEGGQAEQREEACPVDDRR